MPGLLGVGKKPSWAYFLLSKDNKLDEPLPPPPLPITPPPPYCSDKSISEKKTLHALQVKKLNIILFKLAKMKILSSSIIYIFYYREKFMN
jgi:hypothetical protein